MDTATTITGRASPWNKGKLLGQKPPLKLKEIWAIRIRLQLDHRTRELALFNLAINTMRRTKPTLIYRRTKNLRAVQLLLGHTKLESTVRYLAIEVDDALEIAEQTRFKPSWAGRDCRTRRSLTGQLRICVVASEISRAVRTKRPLHRGRGVAPSHSDDAELGK